MPEPAKDKHPRYPTTFSPIKLGPVEVPNRIFMAPHGIPLEAKTIGGGDLAAEPARNRAHYFGDRVAGGVGLIIHSTQVLFSQTNFAESPGLEQAIPAFKAVADQVHSHGGKIFAELWYVNWIQKAWEKLGPEAPGMAPSIGPNLYYPSVRRAMTLREIDMMVEVYRTATRNLRKAGYDGIELHVSHGSLIEYFLSPYFNKREDDYGGSFENRARFMVRLLKMIREEQSPAQALGIRINADELLQGGLDEEATKAVLRYLIGLGLVDFIDLDVSVEPEQAHLMTTGMFDPVMHNLERATRVAEAAGDIPVLATPGRLTSIADAEKILAQGRVNMVGAVRGLIAEPEMVNKSRDGREGERRICVAINACVDGLSVGWGCAINPTAGKENRWGKDSLTKVGTPMNVVVVGAGPAGLEAARIAATRGNKVTVLEQTDRIGGAVANWGRLPGRESMRTLPNYFSVQLKNLGVDVHLNTTATADAVLALAPDVVFVATGSRYDERGVLPTTQRPLPGHDLPHVVTPEAIFRGERLSGKVVILDDEGYHTACGLAEQLAADGCEVIYLTRKQNAGASLGLAIGYIAKRLHGAGVKVITSQYATGLTADAVSFYEPISGAVQSESGVKHVVLATSRTPIDSLFHELDGKAAYVYAIGDALAPRSLRDVIYDGHRFGRVIGEPNMPKYITDELFGMDPAGALASAAAH
jgi:2,4-dienoyl-CoA reductase-like NADH-dependent reductase (Old Yellow Enzyme family)/thioredoxin reductase